MAYVSIAPIFDMMIIKCPIIFGDDVKIPRKWKNIIFPGILLLACIGKSGAIES